MPSFIALCAPPPRRPLAKPAVPSPVITVTLPSPAVSSAALGVLGDFGVDLDCGYVLRPDPVGQQARVVAGARADLQYPLARLWVQCRQHVGHHCWLGGR